MSMLVRSGQPIVEDITENPFAPKMLMLKCLYAICISVLFLNDILQFTRESKVVLGQW